jgi:O-antigen/teichoic acid export membrane protein
MLSILALPLVAALVVFPGQILALFGRDFAGQGAVLAVLAVGQLINVATGPAGYLLMMTGHEADTSRVALGTAALAILLAFLVIPNAGVLGAAWVVTVVVAIRNLAFVVYVQKRLGVSLIRP